MFLPSTEPCFVAILERHSPRRPLWSAAISLALTVGPLPIVAIQPGKRHFAFPRLDLLVARLSFGIELSFLDSPVTQLNLIIHARHWLSFRIHQFDFDPG